MGHFGTAFSNHTSKMTHRVPSKSALHGMFGAAMGFDRLELRGISNRYSFSWDTEIVTSMVGKSRYVFDCINDVKSVVRLKDWERGLLKRSVDYIEHVHDVRGGSLTATWLIELDESMNVDDVMDYLSNPAYPLYLGTSECLVRVSDVEMIEVEKRFDDAYFTGFFVGEVLEDRWVVTERMTECMRDYRMPERFEDVYTLNDVVYGRPKYGYVQLDGSAYCMW